MVFVHKCEDRCLGVNRPRSRDEVLVVMMRTMDQSSTGRRRIDKMSLPVMIYLPFVVGGRFRSGSVTRSKGCHGVGCSVAIIIRFQRYIKVSGSDGLKPL